MQRTLYDQDHEDFRDVVREFVAREVVPHQERWETDRLIGREVWTAAGKQGLLGLAAPEGYGGGGQADFRYRTVMMEEFARIGAASLESAISVHDDIVLPYLLDLGTEEQKRCWVPGMCTGETVSAIAMTEPGAGSDLQGIRTTAVRDGDHWVLDGAKTFITNGIQSDLVIVLARTDPAAGARGMSLFVVERGMPGFTRGRKLDKIGLHAQDTAELFFDSVRVPATNLLGTEGRGFMHLMERLPRERMAIAVWAQCVTETALEQTLEYCTERTAFGKPVADFQHSRFLLAELTTQSDVTRVYIDRAIEALNDGTLTAVDAAKAKWWTTELQTKTVDRCLQLHGGYGYMTEYPIARAYLDARIQTIYGGTTEIMKEIIGRSLGTSGKAS
ncbi:acyl-CoA dehydrogenase family protein [Streptomyces sp. V3I7]|uniref:acyl-CoA dehydrogenase family protein n=1 Tax=Streptomyces sp. V3I7 TaxID=3042278 RepID=UPI00278AB827|nr:acyl-CoA dehydrogenase family protein [Streptomyces sp. V3I7]MDQ0989344.1 alkylation response protein AidB-like acyl-CoA dehydrogenase [Streptomyces sp. V3I7]